FERPAPGARDGAHHPRRPGPPLLDPSFASASGNALRADDRSARRRGPAALSSVREGLTIRLSGRGELPPGPDPGPGLAGTAPAAEGEGSRCGRVARRLASHPLRGSERPSAESVSTRHGGTRTGRPAHGVPWARTPPV